MHGLDIPFFFDKNLTKNFKVFGQILYIYFDPTFRRHVSVVDIGLKQKSSIFVDDIFKYSRSLNDNNFQFFFSKRKDIFFLKPVHFLNSKNERVLKKRYLSFSKKKFVFLNLNRFSFLALKYFNARNENLFKFKNTNFFNFVFLKSFFLLRTLKNCRIYASIFLNFYRNSKKSRRKFYNFLMFLIFIKFLVKNLINIYSSTFYIYQIHNISNLSFFISWFNTVTNRLVQNLTLNFSNLGLTGLSRVNPNNFFSFKTEKNLAKLELSFKKPKKTHKLKFKNKLSKIFLSSRRVFLNGLNESSSLLNLPAVTAGKLSKLELSFKPFKNELHSLNFAFSNSFHRPRQAVVIKKLRTKNYYSILNKGRAYALVNKLSFINLFNYGGVWRKGLFKSWIKFLIYFEKLNYLFVLNNEEVSVEIRRSPYFFYSVFFPLIFNFRNLFFNLLRFFRFFKTLHERSLFRNCGFFGPRKRDFNKKFFGALLNILLISKIFSKAPKNFLLKSSVLHKIDFTRLNFSHFNGLSLIKFFFAGILKTFAENIYYISANLNPNEKFINDSLTKLSLINFSLGFKFAEFSKSQSVLIKNIEVSKNYYSNWVPLFKIFKSLRIVSKYAKKYRRRANFSKRKKFKPIYRKKNYFLATKGAGFKPQKFFLYPFKSRFMNSQRWSSSTGKVRFSSKLARYGSYLDRINLLSKKFKSKVRVFPLAAFKNRLSASFDKSKQLLVRKFYFQKFLLKSVSSRFKKVFFPNNVKKDKFVRRWDRNQFYSNPVFKKQKFFIKNKSNFRHNRFSRKPVVSANAQLKKPIYRARFKKN